MTVAHVDMSEVRQWAARLDAQALKVVPEVRKTTSRAGLNIKQAIQADVNASTNGGIRQIPILMKWAHNSPALMEMDVGPKDGGAGDLANIAFFGTSKGGGRHLFYEHADPEIPVWTAYIAQIASSL